MKNFKKIMLAVVAAGSLTTVSAEGGDFFTDAKAVAGRHMWTGAAGLASAALLVLNNTVVKNAVKKAKTRGSKKANLLGKVQKGLNLAAVAGLVATAYSVAAVEANHDFATKIEAKTTLAADAEVPGYLVSKLADAERAAAADPLTLGRAAELLQARYRAAKALADAKGTVLGGDFNGEQPDGYLEAGDEEGQRGHADANADAVAQSDAFDAYQDAFNDANVDALVRPHLVEQNGFMRFVRRFAPGFNGPSAIPAAAEA